DAEHLADLLVLPDRPVGRQRREGRRYKGTVKLGAQPVHGMRDHGHFLLLLRAGVYSARSESSVLGVEAEVQVEATRQLVEGGFLARSRGGGEHSRRSAERVQLAVRVIARGVDLGGKALQRVAVERRQRIEGNEGTAHDTSPCIPRGGASRGRSKVTFRDCRGGPLFRLEQGRIFGKERCLRA